MAELQRERGFFVGEAELLGLGPHRRDLRGGAAGTNQLDRRVEIIAAALVGVDHGVRRVADAEGAVVAGAIAHVGMQNVVVDGIAGAQRCGRRKRAGADCSARRKWR